MKKSPYVGLARKYRPQLFEEIVGQEAVSTTLRNAAEAKRPAHAYLFFGPRGVGKTTSARLLAKALNCAKGPTPKPCGKCSSCEEISGGTSIDVLELDAASHTQVDKIREMIIETAGLAPSRDRYKVFIIDEVHMLSTSSFNALLKTLEEPPGHVIFVLATTELSKIPATIVSRCQRFRFRPVPSDVIEEYLGKLAKSEKVKADKAALTLLSRAAGGSLRDALSLLEQAAAYGDGKVTSASAAELMGTLPVDFLVGIVGSVLAKDGKSLSGWLEKVVAEGFDATQVLRDLRERLQDLYLHAIGAKTDLDSEWGELAGRPAETYSFLLRRINSTLADIRGADSPQLAFEMGIYGLLEPAHDLGEWVMRLEALERRLAGGVPAPATPAAAASPRPAAAKAPAAPPAGKPAGKPAGRAAKPASGAGPGGDVWASVLGKLREVKPALVSILEGCRLNETGAGRWKLVFQQAFSMERAEADKGLIEKAITELSGRPAALEFEVLAKKGGTAKGGSVGGGNWVDTAEGDGVEDPAAKKALKMFGGKVRQVKKKKS